MKYDSLRTASTNPILEAKIAEAQRKFNERFPVINAFTGEVIGPNGENAVTQEQVDAAKEAAIEARRSMPAWDPVYVQLRW